MYEDPKVVPTPVGTPAPLHNLFNGTKSPGNYVIPFNCYSIPYGTYNETQAIWTLSGTALTGMLKQTFTIPSQALLTKLSASAGTLGAKLQTGAAKYLPYVFASFAKYGVTDPNQMAAMLGEIDHEDNWGTYTDGIEDISEEKARRDYDYPKHTDLGNGAYPSEDGYTYRGRGLVQVTGKANYQKVDDTFASSTVSNPDSILSNPQLAADIAVRGMVYGTFRTHKISDYINSTTQDFYNARLTVNAIDPGDQVPAAILQYTNAYDAILKVNC